MQDNTSNQKVHEGEIIPQSTESTQEPASRLSHQYNFIKRNIKKIFIILIAVLLLESLWAINFVNSSRTAGNSGNSSQSNSFDSSIGTREPGALTPIATMYLDPDANTVSIENEFELAVVINTGDRQINGADSVIGYDPNMLTVIDGYAEVPGIQVKPGSIYNSLLINSVDPVEGKINLTGSRLSKSTPAYQGTGNFAIIRFKAINTGSTEINLILDPTIAKTSSVVEAETSANILTGTGNATIQITE